MSYHFSIWGYANSWVVHESNGDDISWISDWLPTKKAAQWLAATRTFDRMGIGFDEVDLALEKLINKQRAAA